MGANARFWFALGLAVLAHAAVLALSVTSHPRRAAAEWAQVMAVSVDLEAPALPAPAASSDEPVMAAPAPAAVARRTSATSAPSPGAVSVVESVRSPEPSAGAWSLPSVSSRPVGPLLGPVLGEAVRAGIGMTIAQAEAREAAQPPAAVPRITPADLELGLVPGGELVTLAREAAFRSLIPTNSQGMLQFEANETGVVVAGRALEGSVGASEWDALAKEVVQLAQGKTLRAAGGHRTLVTIEVTSALRNVAGAKQPDKPSFASKVASVAGAIINPLDAIAAASVPPRRVVSARIVDVRAP